MMFLPLAHVTVNMPYKSIDTDISVLNVVMDVLMEMDFGILFDMIGGSDLTRVAFITYLLLGSFVVSKNFLELGYLVIFYMFIIVRIVFCK